MKNYTITVNGNVYDVTVEENGAGAAPVARPAAAPKAAPCGSTSTKGSTCRRSRIHRSKSRSSRKSIQDRSKCRSGCKRKVIAVVIIEAMKMEIPVVAPEDGTVASIDVAVGDAIDSGAVLATLN